MTRSLIAAKNLGSAISAFRKSHDEVMETAHILAVSVMSYTANSGRMDMLNDFFAGLSAPLAGAFKQYVGRIVGREPELQWLGFEKGRFTLIVDRQEQRDAFLKEVPLYLEGPLKDDKGEPSQFAPFTTRIALDREADVFGNAEFAAGLDRLIKRATKEGSHVSKQLADILLNARKEIESEREKLDKQAKDAANQNARMTKAKAPQMEAATAH